MENIKEYLLSLLTPKEVKDRDWRYNHRDSRIYCSKPFDFCLRLLQILEK